MIAFMLRKTSEHNTMDWEMLSNRHCFNITYRRNENEGICVSDRK